MSPDLNAIENLWGILARKVYENGRQYFSVNELENAILLEWENITNDTLKNLSDSMPSRVFKLISKEGSII